jgi:hypothetical protein
MSRFVDFDRTVIQMMRDFGGVGTLRVRSDGTYVDGEVVQTTTDYPVNIIMLDYPQVGAGDKANFNTTILEGDKQCYIQPRDKEVFHQPQPQIKANRDTMVIAGTEWKIMNHKDLNTSSAESVLIDLHLRK